MLWHYKSLSQKPDELCKTGHHCSYQEMTLSKTITVAVAVAVAVVNEINWLMKLWGLRGKQWMYDSDLEHSELQPYSFWWYWYNISNISINATMGPGWTHSSWCSSHKTATALGRVPLNIYIIQIPYKTQQLSNICTSSYKVHKELHLWTPVSE